MFELPNDNGPVRRALEPKRVQDTMRRAPGHVVGDLFDEGF